MTLFNEREQAFEQMFVHDEEARFRALAKRNRLLGQWAATQIGLSGDQADAYAKDIGRSLVAAVVDESLLARIQADFAAHGVEQSEEGIRQKMAALMAVALNEVRSTAW